MIDPDPTASGAIQARPGEGVWVVLPTYDEAENIEPIAAAMQRLEDGSRLEPQERREP